MNKRRLFFIFVLLIMLILVTACSVKKDSKTDNAETQISAEESKEETGESKEDNNKTDEEIKSDTTEDEAKTDITEEAKSDTTNEKEIIESEDKDTMAATLFYQGHASARIVTGEGKVIYIDPYMGGGYDLPADLILVTHDHYDHTGTDKISQKNTDCVTITWKESLEDGMHQSFDLGYVKVEAVEAGYNKNHDVSNCVGYILTFSNGISVYFSGDTSTTPQMAELSERNLDYALICCDGVYNMGLDEAAECAKTINAKHNIPYHMAPGSDFDDKTAEAFDAPNKIIVKPNEGLILE